uniref:Uncharacterized protein n=1 Tax=Anguilla anguilla TaxID=7936 RepID=A0A0E9XDA6_ANGAN
MFHNHTVVFFWDFGELSVAQIILR